MNTEMQIEDRELQAPGYPSFVVAIYPDSSTYCPAVVYTEETNNTTAEVILDDILKRYSDAWKKLAEL